jgi:beta-lactamase class A
MDKMLGDAQRAADGARVPLAISFDRTLLEARLKELAGQVDTRADISVISSTKPISRSFALRGGQVLDVQAAMSQIEDRLQSVGAPRRITLELTTASGADARPTPEQLQEQIEAMAKQWKGVVGVYVYDLSSDQVVAALNENTVFSGASVMKVPILLNTYINLDTFSTRHETWLRKMIVESDNYSANTLLSVSVGGGPTDTDKALEGALAMSAMLKDDLGLEHTYQNMPYEAAEYLIKVRGIKIKRGPAQEGQAPYTDADPVLRTTPAEMSRVFLLIEQCSQGQGLLLEKFKRLTAARCGEMIERLKQNGDHTRMVAGLPKMAVAAHKSGWIEDMQADVGIVETPGGNYLTAIYVYRDMRGTGTFLTDQVATPAIAAFSRLIYSYYNPLPAPQ